MGFAPKDNPKVAIFVIVENAGFGATFGVPIGRLMMQKYLKGEVPASDKYIEDRIVNTTILPQTFFNWNRTNKRTMEFSQPTPASNDVERDEVKPFTPESDN